MGHREQLSKVLIVGEFAFVTGLTRLFVHLGLGFLNEHGGNGQRELIGLVEQSKEVDAFDVSFLTLIPIRCNQGAFISRRFLANESSTISTANSPFGNLAWVCRISDLAFRHRSLESR